MSETGSHWQNDGARGAVAPEPAHGPSGELAEQGQAERGRRVAVSRRRWIAAAALGLTILALGSLRWIPSHRLLVVGHWDEVARGRAYLAQRRPDLALQAVLDVRNEAPGAGEAMTVAGLAMLQMRQFQGARLALERVLKLQPNQFDTAVTLADLNLGFGNGKRGLELLELAARLRPREFGVWLAMAKLLNDRGDVSRAIRVYEKAVGLDPSHREALIGLIGAQLKSVRPERTWPSAAKALQKYPDNPVVLGLAARAAYWANRLDEAFSLAEEALNRDARNVQALLARAQSRVAQGQLEQALPDAERAAECEPNDMDALNLLLRIEIRLGLSQRAAATLANRDRAQERARLMSHLAEEIAGHPEDPKLLWSMGQVASESGMALLASRCFMAALALDPNFQPASESLAKLQAARPELVRRQMRTLPLSDGAALPSKSSKTFP